MKMPHAVDPHSETWAAVTDRAEAILEAATAQTALRGLGPVETEFERGRIQAMREILKLVPASEPASPRNPAAAPRYT